MVRMRAVPQGLLRRSEWVMCGLSWGAVVRNRAELSSRSNSYRALINNRFSLFSDSQSGLRFMDPGQSRKARAARWWTIACYAGLPSTGK
jgi:hypothetical protein